MFKPVNRYLYIGIPEKSVPETESGIVLPESFKPIEEKHVIAYVYDWADDVRFKKLLKENCKIIIDRSMAEQFIIEGKQYNVILDNYIIGIV
jgi:co-chaperonin GroES (HSP10)